MKWENEKDYIMRIIKEMAAVLFSVLFGKQYTFVETETENKYEISGKSLKDLFTMIDDGNINEAENIVLTEMNYRNKNEVAAAVLFYQYLSGKPTEFMEQNNFSTEEVLDGLKRILKEAGYGDLVSMIETV